MFLFVCLFGVFLPSPPINCYSHLELTRVCNKAAGLQSGGIRNDRITASSMWDKFHAPYLARLNRKRTGRFMGGWAARHNNHKQWLQNDVGRNFKLTMISTQGRTRANQWVTRYTLSHSLDGVHFAPYKKRDRIKVTCLRWLNNFTIVSAGILGLLRCCLHIGCTWHLFSHLEPSILVMPIYYFRNKEIDK